MKRKILYIQHGGDMGGSIVSLLYTVQAIQRTNNYDVAILCVTKRIVEFYESYGIKTLYSPHVGYFSHNTVSGFYKLSILGLYRMTKQLIYMPLHIKKQIEIIKAFNPDIVHLNATVLISSGIAAFICHKTIVWHIREPLSDGYFGIRKGIISFIIKRLSTVIIAISPFDLSRLGKNTHNNMRIVYNFVDFDYFDYSKYDKNVERARLGLPKDSKVIVTLGGFAAIKGAYEIISLQQYLTDAKNTYILIAGIGYEKENICTSIERIKKIIKQIIKPFYQFQNDKIKNALNSLEHKNKVIMLGRRNDIPKILAAADVLVFAGTVPHFPRPIFEAWAMRKPIVAFDIDGVKQNVDSGIDGMLVKDITPHALGIAINTVLDDKKLSSTLGINGYQKAKRLFDRDINIKQILEIYENV